jgi:hypothetical protein
LTSHEARVIVWKQKHCDAFQKCATDSNQAMLGMGYWSHFLRYWSHCLKCNHNYHNKKRESQESTRKWLNEVLHPSWTKKSDSTKQVILLRKKKMHSASQYFLLHPNKVIFVDEVGSHTTQANDKNTGGKKFVCSTNGWPQQRANMKDAHFTVLGFAAISGEPIMCCIIFASKELEPVMIQGLDPFAS